MTRHEVRECAFLILFERMFQPDSLEELYALAEEVQQLEVNQDVKQMVEGVIAHEEEIQQLIRTFSKSRSIHRISKVNLSILELALYEMYFEKDMPVNAAISEAVTLSHAYSYQEDTAFINGMLGAISRSQPKVGADAAAQEEPTNA